MSSPLQQVASSFSSSIVRVTPPVMLMLLFLLLVSRGYYTAEAFTVRSSGRTGTGTTFRPIWTTASSTTKTNLRSLGSNYLDSISSTATSSSSSYFPSPATTVASSSVGGQYDYVVGILGDLRTCDAD